MEPVRISFNRIEQSDNSLVKVNWKCLPLPEDLQMLIFFSLNEVGLKHASMVSKKWNRETITALKNSNLSGIQFFILKNSPYFNCLNPKETESLLKSTNLVAINYSVDEWIRKVISTLKPLIHTQLEDLHILYKKNERSPFDEIFHLTSVYKEMEFYLGDLRQYEKDIVMSLFTIRDLSLFFSNLDLYRIKKYLVVKHYIFTLLMDGLLKDKNKFDNVINNIENYSVELTENLFCHLTNCLKTNRMNNAQINKMIEVSINLIENSEIDLTEHMLSLFEAMCKLHLRRTDSLSKYPDFKILFDLLGDNLPAEINRITLNNLSNSILNQLLQDEIPEIPKPKKKKSKCAIM